MGAMKVLEYEDLYRTTEASVNIVFSSVGDGPTVVLLHGTSANLSVWRPIQDLLKHAAHVVALDQRGHGRSDKPIRGYTGEDFAQDVVTVLDSLGVQDAVIAGHSMGARNAWVTAAKNPERVRGVVAVDYTPYVEEDVLDELAVRVGAGNREFRSRAEIEDYLRGRYPRILPGALARRAEWGYTESDNGTWRPLASPDGLQQLIDGLRTPWAEEFKAVRTGMSHVRGQDSRIVGESAWERARRARPNDRWVTVAKADHYVPEEYPEPIAEEIAMYL